MMSNAFHFQLVMPVVSLLAVLAVCGSVRAESEFKKADGYRGIWYYNQKTDSEYVYKYSGGLGTYCAKHIPMAAYAPEANKTFFVYGGTKPDKLSVLEMVSYYDHATGQVPKPTILMDKGTADAHDNPVIAIDDSGYVWVFASAHGTSRPAYIFKSKEPYNVDDFDELHDFNYSYPQPWYIPGQGFLFLHTRYAGGRGLNWMTSADGITWSEPKKLAHIAQGHYQVSWPCGKKVGTAFNYHPVKIGLNFRTNLYYVETDDMGKTWKTAAGEIVETPITDARSPALVHDYEAEGLLQYMKDVNYDAKGNPVILHVTSKGWEPGPQNGPHEWRVAHWTGAQWALHTVTTNDNNYDTGCLHIEPDGTWRIIGPTETGPQPYNPGGEIAVWVSKDEGATWTKLRQITHDSPYNHTYARRPVNAHPDFYAFWADGHGREPSDSRLYFCDKEGKRVMRFPFEMSEDFATPELVE